MIQATQRMGTLAFGKGHAQLLGAPPAVDRDGCARSSPFAADHLAGLRIRGEAPIINGIAVVLRDQLPGFTVELDQEIASGIEGNEALGEPLIEAAALLSGERAHGRMLRSRIRQGSRRSREGQLSIDRINLTELLAVGLRQPTSSDGIKGLVVPTV